MSEYSKKYESFINDLSLMDGKSLQSYLYRFKNAKSLLERIGMRPNHYGPLKEFLLSRGLTIKQVWPRGSVNPRQADIQDGTYWPDIFSKVCSGCYKRKAFEEFNNCKTGQYGLHNHCRKCQKKSKRKYYEKNREKEIAKSAERTRSKEGAEYRKQRYEREKERLLAYNRERRKTPAARAKANAAKRRLEERNPSAKIARNMRVRIKMALKGQNKSAATMALLGCTPEELRAHLEKQFKPGMSWDNYGYYGWHVDHIKPCAVFDLTDETQQRECFHYTNLQPLWHKENIRKGGRFDEAILEAAE